MNRKGLVVHLGHGSTETLYASSLSLCFASVLSLPFCINFPHRTTETNSFIFSYDVGYTLYSCPNVVCDSCREEYCCGPICEKCNDDREHLMKCDKCENPVCEKCIVITKGLREGNTCKTCKTGGVSADVVASTIAAK